MAKSQRFPMATHILMVLAFMKDQYLSSDKIAKSVQTNPAAIRRIMAQLHQAGWIESTVGAGGGSRLAVEPVSISLRDVYEAVEEDGIHTPHHPNMVCPVARAVQRIFFSRLEQSEEAMKADLAKTTLSDLLVASQAEHQQA